MISISSSAVILSAFRRARILSLRFILFFPPISSYRKNDTKKRAEREKVDNTQQKRCIDEIPMILWRRR